MIREGRTAKPRRCGLEQMRMEPFFGRLGDGGAGAYPLLSLPSSASVGVAHLCAGIALRHKGSWEVASQIF